MWAFLLIGQKLMVSIKINYIFLHLFIHSQYKLYAGSGTYPGNTGPLLGTHPKGDFIYVYFMFEI